MMRQRGTVDRHGVGWRWRYTATVDGRRHTISQNGYATKTEARKALTAALARHDAGTGRKAANVSTGDYLAGWLDTYRRSGRRKATTIESTTVAVNRYLVPRIGSVPLSKLDGERIGRLYADLLTDGRTGASGTKGGLSPKTVRNVAGVLHKALSDAVRNGRLTTNPATGVDLPTWKRPELTVWDERQAATFLAYVEQAGDPLAAVWRLMLATGLRRGELLGLYWSDVDLLNASLNVVRSRSVKGEDTPKTRKGRRTISLDVDTVNALARMKDDQEAAAKTIGAWSSPYLATDLDGRPIWPQTFTRRFQAAARRAGLPVPRLHDGRHTAATLALQAGVPIHVVSGRLGHEHVSTTLDVYSAYLPAADRDAAKRIGAVLPTPVQPAVDR